MATKKKETLDLTIITLFRSLGLWPGEKSNHKFRLAKVAMFCYFSTYLTQLIALFMSKDDTERLFECFSVISFCGMGMLKMSSLCLSSDIWLKVLNQMSNLEKVHLTRDEDGLEYESDNKEDDSYISTPKSITKYTRNFKKTSGIVFRIYCFTGILFVLSPFVEYAVMVASGTPLQEYPHILPSWNPLDKIHIACYATIIIFEIVAAFYCVCVHIAFDSTAIGVMIFICGQYSLLEYQSERIGGKGKSCALSRLRDERAHGRLIKCHRVHIELLSLSNKLDRLLRNILGVYFFLATLTLCSVAVRLKSEQMSFMQLTSLLEYMAASLTQLYIYCSYGDAVYNNSTLKPGRGPFGAAIWCISPKIRRELALLGFGMMKPVRLHAGPFNTLDLPSFIQIVRAAYSYYAVLGNSK